MEINIPGLDAKSGIELCDGSEAIYLHSLHLYVSNIPASLEKMRNVSEETLHDYAISAHGVKSISQYICAQEAVKTAKELEALAKSGDLAGVLARNDAFIKYAGTLLDSIKSWLEKNDPAGA
jgi:HPt (histidine-containing phosphotransfer) domain-containing protein